MKDAWYAFSPIHEWCAECRVAVVTRRPWAHAWVGGLVLTRWLAMYTLILLILCGCTQTAGAEEEASAIAEFAEREGVPLLALSEGSDAGGKGG